MWSIRKCEFLFPEYHPKTFGSLWKLISLSSNLSAKKFHKRSVVFDRQFSIINMRSSFFSPIDDRIFRSYKIIETLTKLSISCCQDHPFSYFHFIYLNYFYLIKLIKWNYIYNYFKHRIFFNFCSDLNILIFVCLNRTWA